MRQKTKGQHTKCVVWNIAVPPLDMTLVCHRTYPQSNPWCWMPSREALGPMQGGTGTLGCPKHKAIELVIILKGQDTPLVFFFLRIDYQKERGMWAWFWGEGVEWNLHINFWIYYRKLSASKMRLLKTICKTSCCRYKKNTDSANSCHVYR